MTGGEESWTRAKPARLDDSMIHGRANPTRGSFHVTVESNRIAAMPVVVAAMGDCNVETAPGLGAEVCALVPMAGSHFSVTDEKIDKINKK